MGGTQNQSETLGAWIVHHGRKLQSDQTGASEFSAIDGAAKSGLLLAGMSASDTIDLSEAEVVAIAKAARLNPKTELNFYLEQLKQRQLIDIGKNNSVSILGVSSRKVLQETATIFELLGPSSEEKAAIDVAENTSNVPQRLENEGTRIAEQFEMGKNDALDFLRRIQEIGFVDCEGSGGDRLLFNGNLFRRNNIGKTKLVLDSLTAGENERVAKVTSLLSTTGCIEKDRVRTILSEPLFDKLMAAGFYDVNTVSNSEGEHVFITAPAAFHKFVDPMVDDAFDSAKALVAALTYGMSKSTPGRGRIMMPSVLIAKLLSGREVGPATAIGQDYRVLEVRRVIGLRKAENGMYFMRLLKRDIGEIAQQVLLHGDSSSNVIGNMATASMTGYKGPEESRSQLRRHQRVESKKHTADILQTLREQGSRRW